MEWLLLRFVIVVGLIVLACVMYGRITWQRETRSLRQQIANTAQAITPTTYDPRELESLPAPVRRYFQTVLTPGQPLITRMQARHQGQFSLAETHPKWVPFTSTQVAQLNRIGFDWDGQVAMAPGLIGLVHDAYIAGKGLLHATFGGLFTVAHLEDTPEANQGELLRFLAEAAWYPTMLLPSQGVVWTAIDHHTAMARLTDAGTEVTLEFRFDANDLIETVYAATRYRSVAGKLVPTPWQGHFWNYQRRNGMLIPIDGEVAWRLPEQAVPYWRGHLTDITYEFTQPIDRPIMPHPTAALSA